MIAQCSFKEVEKKKRICRWHRLLGVYLSARPSHNEQHVPSRKVAVRARKLFPESFHIDWWWTIWLLFLSLTRSWRLPQISLADLGEWHASASRLGSLHVSGLCVHRRRRWKLVRSGEHSRSGSLPWTHALLGHEEVPAGGRVSTVPRQPCRSAERLHNLRKHQLLFRCLAKVLVGCFGQVSVVLQCSGVMIMTSSLGNKVVSGGQTFDHRVLCLIVRVVDLLIDCAFPYAIIQCRLRFFPTQAWG